MESKPNPDQLKTISYCYRPAMCHMREPSNPSLAFDPGTASLHPPGEDIQHKKEGEKPTQISEGDSFFFPRSDATQSRFCRQKASYPPRLAMQRRYWQSEPVNNYPH